MPQPLAPVLCTASRARARALTHRLSVVAKLTCACSFFPLRTCTRAPWFVASPGHAARVRHRGRVFDRNRLHDPVRLARNCTPTHNRTRGRFLHIGLFACAHARARTHTEPCMHPIPKFVQEWGEDRKELPDRRPHVDTRRKGSTTCHRPTDIPGPPSSENLNNSEQDTPKYPDSISCHVM
jgi:hypothetical protein